MDGAVSGLSPALIVLLLVVPIAALAVGWLLAGGEFTPSSSSWRRHTRS